MNWQAWQRGALISVAAGTWTIHFTNLSLAGSRLDALLPILFLPLGVLLWRRLRSSIDPVARSALGLIVAGAALPMTAALLLLVPPVTLAGVFSAGEFASEERVQSVGSPDKRWIARAYHRGIGAYAAGWGRVRVSIAHRYVPFLERDVYYIPVSYWEEPRSEYVSWISEDQFIALETGDTVSAGRVGFDAPWFIDTPMSLVRVLNDIFRSADSADGALQTGAI